MLPTEAFAEAVAFLRLFDRKALMVTNTLCSSLVEKASSTIRWEEFSCLRFYIANEWINIFRIRDVQTHEGLFCLQFAATLTFPSEHDLVEFVAAAFPNCIFEDVNISATTSKRIIDAIGQVADSVIVKGAVCVDRDMSLDSAVDLVRKFRKVKALQLGIEVSDDDASGFAKFFRGSGVQELRFYCSYSDPAPKTLSLL